MIVCMLVLAAGALNAPAAGAAEDEWDGLVPGEGREDVYYACQACHSLNIVKQQGLSAASWLETIEWMVEEQGMTEPEPDELARIVDYLGEWYGQDKKAMSQ